MMTDLLDAANKVTLDQAIDIAFNPEVWHAELWQARLKAAWERAPDSAKTPDATAVYDLIQKWNRRSDADSEGALAYYAFKKGLGRSAARDLDPQPGLTREQPIEALQKAAAWLKENFGSLNVPYGKYFRVGRRGGDSTWPVGGGSLADAGMATPRAITFGEVGKEMVGHQGQTSTQIVVLTNPPKSYAIIPLGESDHKESGHFDDQAQRLFSKSKAAPTYFLDKPELMKHVNATKVLKYGAAAAAGR